VRIRNKGPLVFDSAGVCRTRCYWCGESVEIPLEIKEGTIIQGTKYLMKRKGVDKKEKTELRSA